MGWELHQADELRARYGPDLGTGSVDGLKALLAENGLSIPRFPGMVWVEERLPGGEAVAVGIAEGPTGPLAYLFPAGRGAVGHPPVVHTTPLTAALPAVTRNCTNLSISGEVFSRLHAVQGEGR
jgi:hypothetical protein